MGKISIGCEGDTVMHVLINPILTCNLKCEYCYLQSDIIKKVLDKHKLKGKQKTAEEWFNGLTWLENETEIITLIDISGGEPTLWKDLSKFLDLVPTKIIIGVTTNAINISEEFLKIDEKRKKNSWLTISTHLDENGNIYEKTLENLKKLEEANFILRVNFVAYPKQVLKYEDVKKSVSGFKLCPQSPIHLEVCVNYKKKPFEFELPKETEKEVEYMIKNLHPGDLSSIKYSLYRKYPSRCVKGSSYLVVVENGDIYECLGYFFEEKKKLGNIFEKKLYRLPENPINCDIFCPCAQNFRGDLH